MNKNDDALMKRLYDLATDFEKIVMLSDTIKNFGNFSDEVSGGTEKILCLAELLSDKCRNHQKLLVDIIPEMQVLINNTK